jgi:hypothetical protein
MSGGLCGGHEAIAFSVISLSLLLKLRGQQAWENGMTSGRNSAEHAERNDGEGWEFGADMNN